MSVFGIACFEQLVSRICKLRCPALDPKTLVPGYNFTNRNFPVEPNEFWIKFGANAQK